MTADWLLALFALGACFIPLGFAWFVLARTARRHRHRRSGGVRDRGAPPMR